MNQQKKHNQPQIQALESQPQQTDNDLVTILTKADDLSIKISKLQKTAETPPGTIKELEELITLIKTKGNIGSSSLLGNANLALLDKTFISCKNYIPETDFFFI